MAAPTEPEARALVQRMLQETFAGSMQLRSQLGKAVMTPTEGDGCWAFAVQSQYRAHVDEEVPVAAEAADADGETIHALLHVVDGLLHELEVYREDGKPIDAWPAAKAWVTEAL